MSLSELTGTIKAGVCAQGVDVYRPRKPGSGVNPSDQAHLERLAVAVKKAEDEIEAVLAKTSPAPSSWREYGSDSQKIP